MKIFVYTSLFICIVSKTIIFFIWMLPTHQGFLSEDRCTFFIAAPSPLHTHTHTHAKKKLAFQSVLLSCFGGDTSSSRAKNFTLSPSGRVGTSKVPGSSSHVAATASNVLSVLLLYLLCQSPSSFLLLCFAAEEHVVGPWVCCSNKGVYQMANASTVAVVRALWLP